MSKRPPNTGAREYETPDPNNPLERYGEVSREFAEAKLSQEPREIANESDPERERWTGTSTAKEIIERRADNLLERFDETSKEFNRVRDFDPENIKAADVRNSSMVEKDRPEHNMKPDKDIAERADRISFDDRWEREKREAQQTRENDGPSFER